MAAGAVAAVVGSNARARPNAQIAPVIKADERGISSAEDAELRALERNAEAPGERTIGVYEERKPAKKGKITKKPWYIIDPRTNKYMGYWDGISMSALIFTAIVTVVEVGFVVPSGKVDELFIINRAVDAIFIFDMGLQFFLMYPQAPTSPTDTVRWIHEPNKITKHYLKGWFTLDFVSIAISAIDYLTLDVFTGGEESDLSNMKIFRVIRVARLVKLVRLVKSSRIMKRLESRMAINYGHLALFKCMVGIIIAAHWYACVWGLITGFETMDQTWYVNCGYCEFDPKDGGVVAAAALANPNNASLQEEYTKQLEDEREYACQGPYERYMAALYWAIMTITSIGYGDIAATPQNAYEQAWCAFLMLLGGMIWGAVIATFCGVIANLDPGGTEFRKTMDELNSFMAEQGLDQQMRVTLREYFHQTKHLQVARANRELINAMSPMLQGQVVWKINERWLRHVWFLRQAEDKFMVELSLKLNAAVFAPAELCPPGYMYISHRGIALYGGKVLTSGKVWGEDMILNSTQLRSKYAARCMTYVEVYMISREELLNLAKTFPPTLKIIRRSAFRLGFRREMIRRASESLREKAAAAGVVDKGSAAERMMVQISTKEKDSAEEIEKAQEAAAGAKGKLPPLEGSPAGAGFGAGELQRMQQQLDAMSRQMEAQNAKTNQALEALAKSVEVLANK